jgi:hypothetical protein
MFSFPLLALLAATPYLENYRLIVTFFISAPSLLLLNIEPAYNGTALYYLFGCSFWVLFLFLPFLENKRTGKVSKPTYLIGAAYSLLNSVFGYFVVLSMQSYH